MSLRPWLLSAALAVSAGDAFAYSSYGSGNLTCGEYLDKRGEDQERGEVQNTMFIHAFLAGYLTAGNMLHGMVGEEAGNIDIDLHRGVQWLDAWCTRVENKEVRLAVALEALWVEAAEAKAALARKRAVEGR